MVFRRSDTRKCFNEIGEKGSGASVLNHGYWNRKKLFLTDNNADYRKFSAHFISKILTDFSGACNALLIPGVEVKIELVLNNPELYLMSNTTCLLYTSDAADE